MKVQTLSEVVKSSLELDLSGSERWLKRLLSQLGAVRGKNDRGRQSILVR